MRITTPTTIWGFLLGQLLKLLLLTCAVVVSALAFIASLRMFANGTLGPLETLTLAGWLTVPMLQYALPFAGGFAATLAYHRMSQDNELTACYAGGVAHRTVLLPALALGAVAGGMMFVLADQVMPRFLRSAQEMITSDPGRLLAGRLGKGQSLSLDRGRKVLFADDVTEVDLAPGSQAFKHLVLRGVVALELDDKGNVEREVSSRLADVWLYRDAQAPAVADVRSPAQRWSSSEGGTTAVMQLRDPVGSKTGVATGTVDQTVLAYKLPSTFRDRAKFLSWAQLEQAYSTPQRLTGVDDQRRLLAQALAERAAVDQLREELRRVGRATMVDGAGRAVVVRAQGVSGAPGDRGFTLTAAPGRSVEVTVVGSPAPGREDDERGQVHRAARAFIGQPTAGTGGGTSLTLVMEEVSTAASGTEAAGVLTSLTVPGLRPAIDPLGPLMGASLESLSAAAAGRLAGAGTADAPLRLAAQRLDRAVERTRREIRSMQHERVAVSLSCVLMVLLGAVMGMRLGTAAPLVVYAWSFLPALGAVVAVSGGQTMVVQQGAVGLAVLHGGVAVVAALTFVHYRLLVRH